MPPRSSRPGRLKVDPRRVAKRELVIRCRVVRNLLDLKPAPAVEPGVMRRDARRCRVSSKRRATEACRTGAITGADPFRVALPALDRRMQLAHNQGQTPAVRRGFVRLAPREGCSRSVGSARVRQGRRYRFGADQGVHGRCRSWTTRVRGAIEAVRGHARMTIDGGAM